MEPYFVRAPSVAVSLLLLSLPACSDDAGSADTNPQGSTSGASTTSPSGTEASQSSSGSGVTTDVADTTAGDAGTTLGSGGETGTVPDGALVIGGDEADYPDFTSAIADWAPQSVPEGGLLFVVTPGEYDERIVVPAFEGASEADPVEFRALGEVWITGEGTAAEGESTVRLEGTDWVTFDGVGVRDDSATVEIGMHLVGTETDGVNNVTIRDASIRLGSEAMVPARTFAIRLDSGKTMPGPDGISRDNRFEGLDIDRVGRGIALSGPSPEDIFMGPLYDDPDTGNAIVGCTFGAVEGIGHGEDTNGYAINVFNHADVLIADNRFVQVAITDVEPLIPAGPSAISLDGADGSVVRNRIDRVFWSGVGGSQVSGIRASVTPQGTLTIANNFISGLSRGTDYVSGGADNTLYVTGISVFRCFDCDTVDNVANVIHNTISLTLEPGRSYPVAAFALSGGSSGQVNAVLRNNIIRVEGGSNVGTARAYGLVDGNTDRDWFDSDGNVLWVEGPGGIVGQVGRELGGPATEASNLATWQSISDGDANAVEVEASFADAGSGDLHLAGASASDAALQMDPVTGVDDDIDGEARGEMPFAGADEP